MLYRSDTRYSKATIGPKGPVKGYVRLQVVAVFATLNCSISDQLAMSTGNFTAKKKS